MPYVNVKVGGPLTEDQRREIASEICDTLGKVAGKPRHAVYVVFDEIERARWAVGDDLLTDMDAKKNK